MGVLDAVLEDNVELGVLEGGAGPPFLGGVVHLGPPFLALGGPHCPLGGSWISFCGLWTQISSLGSGERGRGLILGRRTPCGGDKI